MKNDIATTVRLLLSALPEAEQARIVQEVAPTTEARVIRRTEAARLLSCVPRSIDRLAAQGILHRVCLPGRSRAAGFRLHDVQALIGGVR